MNMKPGLQLKAAIIPLVLAGALSGIISGCKKNNNSNTTGSSGSSLTAQVGNAVDAYVGFTASTLTAVDDTAAHEIQITGTGVIGGESATLAIYFPDSIAGPTSYLLFDGIETIMNYTNQAASQNYVQIQGSASGTLQITYLNKTTHQVRANFMGAIYKNGSPSDSLMNVYNGALIATYTAP